MCSLAYTILLSKAKFLILICCKGLKIKDEQSENIQRVSVILIKRAIQITMIYSRKYKVILQTAIKVQEDITS